jgi:hypothetical protein
LGEVAVLDLTNVLIANTVSVPQARRMVMNHGANTMLVFSDHYACPLSGGSGSALTVLNISAATASTTPSSTTICGFDEAVWGVFSSDDSTAYIMNCGPECSSSYKGAASVAVLNMASNTITSTVLLKNLNGAPNAGATVGALNGTQLYVAGTTGGLAGAGTLTVLNVGSTPPVASSPVQISDGYHSLMALGSNNKVVVGSSTNCTNNPSSSTPTGCLTIFNASTNTAVIDAAKGLVTGMAPIANRNVVYVVEGGALLIYDTTTSQQYSKASVDIIGTAVDVKTIDQ